MTENQAAEKPQKLQITFRGRRYDAKPFSGIKILPFAKAMGLITEDGDYIDMMNQDPETKDAMARAMIRSLAEPQNHHRIAYSLKQMVPGLPAEACDYQVVTSENGSSSVRVTLDMEHGELFELLGQLRGADEFEKSKGDKKAPALKPLRFGNLPPEGSIVREPEQRRSETAIAGLSAGAIAALKESGVDLSPAGL